MEGGGDASLVEARFVEGLSDEQVREMFRAARDADYLEITGEARELARKLPRKNDLPDDRRAELEAQLARLHKRVTEVASVDFFAALNGKITLMIEKLLARDDAFGLVADVDQHVLIRDTHNDAAYDLALLAGCGALFLVGLEHCAEVLRAARLRVASVLW